jgi:hypothetical protein
MIARESFTLNNNFMAAFGIGVIEGGHEEMEIRCQCLHDRNFMR